MQRKKHQYHRDDVAALTRKTKASLSPRVSTPDRPANASFYVGPWRVVVSRKPTHKLYSVYAGNFLVGRQVSLPSEGCCQGLARVALGKGIVTRDQLKGFAL